MQRTTLSDTTRVELTRLQQPATLLEQVKQLGHYPKRFEKPATDKERAENSLAEKISKQWTTLDEATKAEVTRLQKETKDKDVKAQAEIRASDILERLRALGKWPQEHAYSLASDPDIIAEAQLAHDLRKCRSSGIFGKAAEAEIDEFHWIWMREREAEAIERNAAAQDRRRDAAKARTTRLRTLLQKLRSSKWRCDCHDFAHWYGLWRCNPELAIRLRLAGHHFEHCRLYSKLRLLNRM